MFRRLCYLFLIAAPQCVAPRPTIASPESDAVLAADRLVVGFEAIPLAASKWPAPSVASVPGYYDWRFGVSGSSGFTASAGIGARETGAAEARGSLADVARQLRLHRCTPGGHILTCADTLFGTIAIANNRLVVTVRDPALVADLRGARPRYLWRAVFLADTILRLDSVPLTYRP